MAGAQESNFIPQKYTYRQDIEPTNPKNGSLWIDTSGNNVETNIYDGESESWELITARGPDQPDYPVLGSLWRDTGRGVLKQYNGASFVTVGNSIDNSSITKNAQGDLQVEKPSKIVLSDLNSLDFSLDGSTLSETQTVDLTNVETLTVDMEVYNDTNAGSTTGKVIIGGTTEVETTISSSAQANRQTYDIDVSSYSGDQDIEIEGSSSLYTGYVKTFECSGTIPQLTVIL